MRAADRLLTGERQVMIAGMALAMLPAGAAQGPPLSEFCKSATPAAQFASVTTISSTSTPRSTEDCRLC